MQNNEPPEFYKVWLETASHDELSLKAVVKDGSPNTACFLAQQMAEKLLKSLLVFSGDEFPKIHDLSVLAGRLQKLGFSLEEIEADLKYLNSFYAQARYADDLRIFSHKEAGKAAAHAEHVKEFVLGKIKV